MTSTSDVVAAVEEDIRSRVGEQPFAVLGSSFGGMIARSVAHDFRDQVLGLATLASVHISAHGDWDLPERTVLREDPTVVRDLGEVGEMYAEMAVVQTPDNARAFVEHVHPGLMSVDKEVFDRILERYALAEEPEEVSPAPFTQPGLFVSGRQDHVVGYRDAWTRIEHYPRTTFVVLDAAGHNVLFDQPAITAALVTDWLQRVAAER